MPLSTSNSESRSQVYKKASACLLVAIIAIYAVFETASRTIMIPSSKIIKANYQEWDAARNIRRTGAGPRTVLFLGNSLLDEGVDFARLQQSVAASNPGWRAQRLMIEDTTYVDWSFGLKRLIEEGAQPDAVVLTLTPEQIVSNRIRESMFSTLLFRPSDLAQIMSEAELHPTDAVSLVVGRYSWCYGFRADWRKNVLRKVIPGFGDLARLMLPPVAARPNPKSVGPEVERRIRLVMDAAESSQMRFALIIPPVAEARSFEKDAVQAVRHAGVAAMLPVRSGNWGPERFRDGFHLASSAKADFTSALTPEVNAWLAKDSIVDARRVQKQRVSQP